MVEVLNLEFNKLRDLPADAFSNLTTLKVLWLTGNHYGPSEREYKKKAALGNELAALPDGIFDPLPNLQVLLVHHNKLTELPPGIFRKQEKLKVLKLLDNPFKPRLTKKHPAFKALLKKEVLYQLDLQRDSGDALEDFWEETRTYYSDEFWLGPPDRRGAGEL